jgi:hypothetical protein
LKPHRFLPNIEGKILERDDLFGIINGPQFLEPGNNLKNDGCEKQEKQYAD